MEDFSIPFGNGVAPKHPRDATVLQNKQIEPTPQAWSTAKCMRILRPLEANLKGLRRLRANTPRHILNSSATRTEAHQQPPPQVHQDTATHSTFELEPDWVKNTTISKRGKTYSRRGRPRKDNNNSQIKSLTPSITMPTPMIARYVQKRDIGVNPEALASTETEKAITESEAEKSKLLKIRGGLLWRVLNKDPLAQEALRSLKTDDSLALPFVEGVCNCLNALYAQEARGAGSNSLLDTCVRKVPSYIRSEQIEVLQCSEPNSAFALAEVGAVAHEIYEDVGEVLPADPRSREIMVSCQARDLLQEAIREGLFTENGLRLIIRTCILNKSYKEAESFAEAFLSSQPVIPSLHGPQVDIFMLKPMQDLVCLKLANEKNGSYHRILTSLFISGPFTLACFPSLSRMFSSEIRRASEFGQYQSAAMDSCLELSEWALAQLSGVVPATSKTKPETLAEIRTMVRDFLEHLMGVCLMQEYEVQTYEAATALQTDTKERLNLLKKVLEIILRVARAGCPGQILVDYGDHTFRSVLITAITAIIAHGSIIFANGSLMRQLLRGFSYLEKISKTPHDRDNFSASVTRFLQDIIQACKLDWNHEVFGFCLSKVRDFLNSDFCVDELYFNEQLHFGLIFARSASQNAERRGDTVLLNLAKEFEGFMIEQDLVLPNAIGNNVKRHDTEFIWDDGLSEWVLKTPANQRTANISVDDSSSREDTEIFDEVDEASSVSSVGSFDERDLMERQPTKKRSIDMIKDDEEEEEDELSGLYVCGIRRDVFLPSKKQTTKKRIKTAFQELMEAGSDDL